MKGMGNEVIVTGNSITVPAGKGGRIPSGKFIAPGETDKEVEAMLAEGQMRYHLMVLAERAAEAGGKDRPNVQDVFAFGATSTRVDVRGTGCRSAGCRTLAECLCTCRRCRRECACRRR